MNVQRNFLRFLAKVFGLIVQNDFTCPGGFSVEKHVCLWKKSFSLSFLILGRNISNFYPEHFSKELSILLSRCSEERFYKSFSCKNYQVFFLYLAKMRKKVNFERKILTSLPQLLWPDEHFQWFLFQNKDKFFLIFGLEQKKWLFGRFFFRQVFQNYSLLVRMNCLTNSVSWIFLLFMSLSKSVQPCVAFFSSLVEAAYWSQEETFEENTTFIWK